MGVKMMPIRCCLRSLTSAAGCRQCTASWRPIGPSLQSPALPVIKECAVWSVCLFPSRYRSRTPCAAKTENLVVDFGWPLKLWWRKRTFNWIFDGMSVSCWLDVQITVNRFDLKYFVLVCVSRISVIFCLREEWKSSSSPDGSESPIAAGVTSMASTCLAPKWHRSVNIRRVATLLTVDLSAWIHFLEEMDGMAARWGRDSSSTWCGCSRMERMKAVAGLHLGPAAGRLQREEFGCQLPSGRPFVHRLPWRHRRPLICIFTQRPPELHPPFHRARFRRWMFPLLSESADSSGFCRRWTSAHLISWKMSFILNEIQMKCVQFWTDAIIKWSNQTSKSISFNY